MFFFFFIFSKFFFFGLFVGSEGKKWSKMTKNLSIVLHISGTKHIWLSFMVHMCKMIISPGIFLISQNFDFPGCQGVKGQKMSQNDRNVCLLHLIFQESYIIWSSFMVHICKRITLTHIFFIFQNFDFQDH